jgi:hypothetical protein
MGRWARLPAKFVRLALSIFTANMATGWGSRSGQYRPFFIGPFSRPASSVSSMPRGSTRAPSRSARTIRSRATAQSTSVATAFDAGAAQPLHRNSALSPLTRRVWRGGRLVSGLPSMAAAGAAVQGRRHLQFCCEIGACCAREFLFTAQQNRLLRRRCAVPALRSGSPDSHAASRRREQVFDEKTFTTGGSDERGSIRFRQCRIA